MMHIPGPLSRSGRPRLPRPPRRTARLRLTLLYGAAFVVCGACGAVFFAAIYLFYAHVTTRLPSHAAPKAVRQGTMTVHVVGLGQFVLDRRELLGASGITALVMIGAAATLGWFLAGRVLRPLSAITATARRISASSLHERLALPGPDDELKELADTLDALFARLESAFDAQRRFAANASHELRTPLTRERTLLQVTLADPASTSETWQTVSRELLASNAEQERLIEALLTLAGSEAGAARRESVDLALVTREALAAARSSSNRLALHIRTDIRPAALDGDPTLIQQLAANLIDNAVRHNIPGGDVEITTGTGRTGATLSVANSGPVIPPDEVDRLFQPFQRLGPRTARRDGGHGLGLSIVRAIAAAHGAAIEASALPEGGLAVAVSFPPQTAQQARQPRSRARAAA